MTLFYHTVLCTIESNKKIKAVKGLTVPETTKTSNSNNDDTIPKASGHNKKMVSFICSTSGYSEEH